MSRFSWFHLATGVLIAGILGINVFLILQNLKLRNKLDLLTDHKEIKSGDVFPAFSAIDLAGQWTHIDFQDPQKKHLLILFSTTCPACSSSLDEWLDLINELNHEEWSVIWLSRDSWQSTGEFSSLHNLTGRVLSEFPYRAYRNLGLRLVPRTLVIGVGGTVENIWVGRFNEKKRAELSLYVSTKTSVSAVNPGQF